MDTSERIIFLGNSKNTNEPSLFDFDFGIKQKFKTTDLFLS